MEPSDYLDPLMMDELEREKLPTVVLVIGMAGSGKTTMMKSLWDHFKKPVLFEFPVKQKNELTTPSDQEPNSNHIDQTKQSDHEVKTVDCSYVRSPVKTYLINLDPAVLNVPYPVNIDIRDTIKYKDVMKNYKLGPNGAIMTCLNLFASKFDGVLGLIQKRYKENKYVFVDTPGQIEVFNWSASGVLITDSLAVSYPTIIMYIIDTEKSQQPITFMSNMMYACSVMYKMKLPFLIVFNKIDVKSPEICLNWMDDYDSYCSDVLKDPSYMASLSRSCAIVTKCTSICSNTVRIRGSRIENRRMSTRVLQVIFSISSNRLFLRDYLPWLMTQREAISKKKSETIQKTMEKYEADKKN